MDKQSDRPYRVTREEVTAIKDAITDLRADTKYIRTKMSGMQMRFDSIISRNFENSRRIKELLEEVASLQNNAKN